MTTLSYLDDKFSTAVALLAASESSLARRIHRAHLEIRTVFQNVDQVEDEAVRRALGALQAMLPGSGYTTAEALERYSDEDLRTIAHKIVNVAHIIGIRRAVST